MSIEFTAAVADTLGIQQAPAHIDIYSYRVGTFMFLATVAFAWSERGFGD